MNKNVKRLLALTLALIMVFATAVPVLATNTNNTANTNNNTVLQVINGNLWIKFHVNYEKSKVFVINAFTEAAERDPALGTDLPVDENGDVMWKLENWDGEDLFLCVYDINNAQPRYFRIFAADTAFGVDSEELQADGTPMLPAAQLGTDANIQPVKLAEEVWVNKPVKFALRFQYSDPNVVNDVYVLATNFFARVFSVANGADETVEANRTYLQTNAVRVATDGTIEYSGPIAANRDYYVMWWRNPANDPGPATGELAAWVDQADTQLIFKTGATADKLFGPNDEVWAIERDAKGNHTNAFEWPVTLTPVELGRYLLRALGTGNQPVRNVQFDVFKLQQTDAYHYAQDQDGNYQVQNPAIYRTLPTNWNGYTGIARNDIRVHPATGVVSIRCNTGADAGKWVELRAGELLGVRANFGTFPAPGAADTGYKYNGKVYALNLWKIIDVNRYNEAQKNTSIDPKTVFALRDDKVVVSVPFADLFAKIRVKIFNAGATPQVRTPVTGATVAMFKADVTQIGGELKAGDKIIEKKTDEFGIVTFNDVPLAEVKQFFNVNPGAVLGAYQRVSLPYLIKQMDVGAHEGLTPYPEYISTAGYFEVDNGSTMTAAGLSVTRADYGLTFDIEIENHGDVFYPNGGGRIAGANRFETAVAIAEAQFPDGLEKKDGFRNVVVAEVDTFADALTAGVVAFEYKAPLLMVAKNEIPEATAEYVKDAGAERVIIVGGPNTISEKVAAEFGAMKGVSVKRIFGQNRFETAAAVGDAFRALLAVEKNKPAFNKGYDTKSAVFLANGHTFADALTATVPAAHYGIPILLTYQDKIAPETLETLKAWDIERVIIVGGEKSVSETVANQLRSASGKGYTVERYAGENRQYTSMILGKEFFADSTKAFFANGTAFADALAGAPYAARVGAPILLVEKDTVSDAVKQYLKDRKVTDGTLFGGQNQISEKVRTELANVINLRADIKGIW